MCVRASVKQPVKLLNGERIQAVSVFSPGSTLLFVSATSQIRGEGMQLWVSSLPIVCEWLREACSLPGSWLACVALYTPQHPSLLPSFPPFSLSTVTSSSLSSAYIRSHKLKVKVFTCAVQGESNQHSSSIDCEHTDRTYGGNLLLFAFTNLIAMSVVGICIFRLNIFFPQLRWIRMRND